MSISNLIELLEEMKKENGDVDVIFKDWDGVPYLIGDIYMGSHNLYGKEEKAVILQHNG